MRVLDLFSGSKSLEKPVLDRGWEYFSIDVDPEYEPDMVADIYYLEPEDIPFSPDIIWASPPCTYFSVASIGNHWTRDSKPKSENALMGVMLVERAFTIIGAKKPTWWFLENPVGKLRKLPVMDFVGIRNTVTYCQYGDTRMKPTDIWTNNPHWIPRLRCNPGDPCHESAPRGSRTGTQGLENNYERSKVPKELLNDILDSCVLERS